MPNHQTAAPLEPELEALAHAAQQRLRAAVDEHDITATKHAVINAASAAIAAGITLSAIAAAEQTGQDRARAELGNEALRRVERTARRARETEAEQDHAIARAARLGLAHRDIATAAQIPHSTIRAIIARAPTANTSNPTRATRTQPRRPRRAPRRRASRRRLTPRAAQRPSTRRTSRREQTKVPDNTNLA